MSYSYSLLPEDLVTYIGGFLKEKLKDLKALSEVDKKTRQILKKILINIQEEDLVNSTKKLFIDVHCRAIIISDSDKDQIAPRDCLKCHQSLYALKRFKRVTESEKLDQKSKQLQKLTESEKLDQIEMGTITRIYFCKRDALHFSRGLQKLTEYEKLHQMKKRTLYRKAMQSIHDYEKEALKQQLLEKQAEEESYRIWDA